ncbi:MFS transporter [Rhizodiscina lignyota]|uniref:MFS transporter n=1 Tax=Rhizodiscina lignyota TaxID=1504668 RepID=A0A9P4IDH5_9PEZI|nr:MFS transporter [Rhizodiscina lignyota]
MPKPTVEHAEDDDHHSDHESVGSDELEATETQPLRTPSREGLADDVAEFARGYNLMHKLEIFEKAAALIQSSTAIEDIPSITDEEIAALRRETERKWSQPKMLYFTILVCSIGAIEQGWAQTSMNGANLYFPREFGIGSPSPRDKLIVGLINSGIYLSTGIIGAWLSEPINRRVGRRGAIFMASWVCLISNIASALSGSWLVLLLFRVLLGVGLGIDASTVSVFAAECAPSAIRGGLAVSWQMWVAFGIFLGFVANVAVYDFPNPWRLQLAAPLLPTIPLLIMVFMSPESPAWYIKSEARYDLAFRSLCKLRNTELQAAKEVYAAYLQHQAKGIAPEAKSSFLTKMVELVSVPRIRRATIASYTVMLSQQLCGINIIAFYSSSIFVDAGFSDFGALLASCIFGFVNFVGAFPAVWTMDTLGRRSLLLLTLPFMALTMFAAGLSFSIPEDNPAHFALLATMIYLFCAEYSPGMGPVPSAYSAEVFPLSNRDVGMSLAVATANVWAAVLSLTFPRIMEALRPQGAFTLYAALNVVAVILVFFFVPETKRKSLEELDEVFSVPTRTFVRYQTTEYLPWFVRRYILRQKGAELRPLGLGGEYRQVGQEDDDDEES